MNDSITKIIKREDGTQYQICVGMGMYNNYGKFHYKISVVYKAKNKRKWENLPDKMSSWIFRELSMEEREKYRFENMLKFVTEEEILEAQLELWAKIKPTLPIYKGKEF
jgi:hypothetical protein